VNSASLQNLWLLGIVANSVTLVLCIYFWREARREKPDFRLQLRITDMWAAIFGLTPTFVCFAALLAEPEWAGVAPIFLVVFLPHQVATAFIFLLREETGDSAAKGSALSSFVVLLSGTIAGVALPVLALFLVGAFCFLAPIVLPVLLLYCLARKAVPAPEKPGDEK
jgi:hypothetical protein